MLLEDYLRENHIWHRFMEKAETIHTSDAARVTGIDLHRITKNLVSKTDGDEFVMLIIPGDRKADLKRVAKILGVKNVQVVPFDQAEKISGYPPGGMPSLGHKTKMRVLVDEALLNYETVYCGGGSREKLLKLRTEDVIRLNNAIVAEILV